MRDKFLSKIEPFVAVVLFCVAAIVYVAVVGAALGIALSVLYNTFKFGFGLFS